MPSNHWKQSRPTHGGSLYDLSKAFGLYSLIHYANGVNPSDLDWNGFVVLSISQHKVENKERDRGNMAPSGEHRLFFSIKEPSCGVMMVPLQCGKMILQWCGAATAVLWWWILTGEMSLVTMEVHETLDWNLVHTFSHWFLDSHKASTCPSAIHK